MTPAVQSLRLKEVEVDDDAWKQIEWGITRCSKWAAHDTPASGGGSPPDTSEIKSEIEKIRALVKLLKIAGEKTKDRRKALLEAPTS